MPGLRSRGSREIERREALIDGDKHCQCSVLGTGAGCSVLSADAAWDHAELQRIHETRAGGVREHIQPVVRADRRCPFELPRFRVAKKIDFLKPLLVRLLGREAREHLERRARVECRVVTRLASIARAEMLLGSQNPTARAREWRARTFELAEALFQSIRMQLAALCAIRRSRWVAEPILT